MKSIVPIEVTKQGSREIVMRRTLDAPRALAFDAFVRPQIVRRWLLGPDGWSMPVCEIDARVGGKFHYVWAQAGRESFELHGVFRELVRPERIVHSERFEPDWYNGECIATTVFTDHGAGTLVTITLLFEDEKSRDLAAFSGMETGVERGYQRLDEMMADGFYTVLPVTRQPTAVVKGDVAFADLRTFHLDARRKITEALPNLGPGAGETWVTLHRARAGDKLYLEPGVMVAKPVKPHGNVVASELPGGNAVHHLLVGPFDQLPQAWPALTAWCARNGHKLEGTCWEVYGPQASDPEKQETQLFALLAE